MMGVAMIRTNASILGCRLGSVAVTLFLLSACASSGSEGGPAPDKQSATSGDAVSVARALGSRDNLAFSLMGGAAVGGELGAALLSRPDDARRSGESTAGNRQDDRRRLAYDRQSERLRELVRREVTKQRLFDDVRRERLSAPAPKRTTAAIATAQRYLKANGFYDGHVDGVLGVETRDAVVRYQARNKLPQDGNITPAMIDKMRAAL